MTWEYFATAGDKLGLLRSRLEMRYILKAIFCCTVLFGTLAVAFADEGQQVRMLQLMFAQPEDSWRQMLTENKALLDTEFFQRVEQRIHWSLSQSQIQDSIRFAQVGDLALAVVGEKPRFAKMLATWSIQDTRGATPP